MNFYLVRSLFLSLLVLNSCAQTDEGRVEEIMQKLHANDVNLAPPQPGDWLYSQEEEGQTFEQYKNESPVSPDGARNVLFLQPIGEFDALQLKLIKYTADYLEVFYGLKTEILPVLPSSLVPDSARRSWSDGNGQLLAPYILNEILIPRLPANAICVMAITEKDLYPKESWNYVFGLPLTTSGWA